MEFSFKLKVNAAKETIWQYYANIKNWYKWEEDLEDISLNGNFETGSMGTMKLAGMPPMGYTLTEVIENRAFCDKTPTPIGTVYFNHEILEEADGVYIKHSVGLDQAETDKEKLEFLKQIFSDVPNSILILKMEVEK